LRIEFFLIIEYNCQIRFALRVKTNFLFLRLHPTIECDITHRGFHEIKLQFFMLHRSRKQNACHFERVKANGCKPVRRKRAR